MEILFERSNADHTWVLKEDDDGFLVEKLDNITGTKLDEQPFLQEDKAKEHVVSEVEDAHNQALCESLLELEEVE